VSEHIDQNTSEQSPEGASNIFLNLHQEDSTGIPSLKAVPESAIASSESESRMSVHMVVALGVVAVGAGVIYAMRYIGMKAGLDEEIAQIDYTSQSENADFNSRFGQVIGELDESTIAVQLSDHESFIDAPFARPSAMGSTPEPVQVDPGMSEEERYALQRERELELERQRRYDSVYSEAMSFRIQGVVGGSRPAARISGQPVSVGSQLGEYFKVIEITGRSVVIEADGMRFELALGEDTKQLD
tara:strand:- start:19778 stop:20509 length:732 start_codon:yes stop_codon:yes gene_type:complete